MEPISPEESGSQSPEALPSGDVPSVVEHLFRHESGKIVAILTRAFGPDHLGLAEDVVQEALARALRTWPFHGIPDRPAAWIMRASRNLALDVVRRRSLFLHKQDEIIGLLDRPSSGENPSLEADDELDDDLLRLMFVCCHPEIPEDAQVALALKTLCGFGVAEISRAFLSTEAAVIKRLTRAKQRIREAGIAFEIPESSDQSRRLDGVLRVLYLLFNEGYKASVGDRLVREDVCQEAIRLTRLLAGSTTGDQPRVHALLALMLLSAARFSARVDDDGNLLRLRDQDRTLWDRELMARGMYHLTRSAVGNDLSVYHLQAGIAACHGAATDYEDTDWQQVLRLYNQWVEVDGSPVVALNRAVAVAQVYGPRAGLEALEAIRGRQRLESYYLFHAVLGEFELRLDHPGTAAGHFRRAQALASLVSEQRFLARRQAESEALAMA